MSCATAIMALWLIAFTACCAIWNIQVGLCALAAMILAQFVIDEFTPPP